jgi:hypothetical protein
MASKGATRHWNNAQIAQSGLEVSTISSKSLESPTRGQADYVAAGVEHVGLRMRSVVPLARPQVDGAWVAVWQSNWDALGRHVGGLSRMHVGNA